MKTIVKKVSTFMDKSIFLLGNDEQGHGYWLESPQLSVDGALFGALLVWDKRRRFFPSVRRVSRDCPSAIRSASEFYGMFPAWELVESTLTQQERLQFAELFGRFYHFMQHRDLLAQGYLDNMDPEIMMRKNLREVKKIDEQDVPGIIELIIGLLTPSE